MIGADALHGLTSSALVVSDAALPSMKATALFWGVPIANKAKYGYFCVDAARNSPKFVASKAALGLMALRRRFSFLSQ